MFVHYSHLDFLEKQFCPLFALYVVDIVLSGAKYFNCLLGLVPLLLSIRAAQDSAKFAEWSYSLVLESTIARAMDYSKLVTQRDSKVPFKEGKNHEVSPSKANSAKDKKRASY